MMTVFKTQRCLYLILSLLLLTIPASAEAQKSSRIDDANPKSVSKYSSQGAKLPNTNMNSKELDDCKPLSAAEQKKLLDSQRFPDGRPMPNTGPGSK